MRKDEITFEMYKQKKFNYNEKDVQALIVKKQVKKISSRVKKFFVGSAVAYLLLFNVNGVVYGSNSVSKSSNNNSSMITRVESEKPSQGYTLDSETAQNLKHNTSEMIRASQNDPALIRQLINEGLLTQSEYMSAIGAQTLDTQYKGFTPREVLYGVSKNNSVSHETEAESDHNNTNDVNNTKDTNDTNNIDDIHHINKKPVSHVTKSQDVSHVTKPQDVTHETSNNLTFYGVLGILGVLSISLISYGLKHIRKGY